MIKALKGLVLNNDGPWGPINDGNKNKKPQNNGAENEFEEIIKVVKSAFNDIFGGNGGNKNPKSPKRSGEKPPVKSVFGIIILVIVALWLATGFYKVNSDENAVVLYFGKFHSVTTPGLNYRLPAPFGKVIKRSVTKVNTYSDTSLMLTGDENIVDLPFNIQWYIGDIRNFVFNIADNRVALEKSAQSAIREVIAKTPIDDALSDGKQKIELETKTLLQEILDSYGAGIIIKLVQLGEVSPPSQVIDSFKDVQTAKADKEKLINQAKAYSNGIVPVARGEAEKLIQEAQGYEQSVLLDAQGQASRFNAVYNEYRRAKVVTRRRIYLETMEKIYANIDKTIISKDVSKSGVVPYLPLKNNLN